MVAVLVSPSRTCCYASDFNFSRTVLFFSTLLFCFCSHVARACQTCASSRQSDTKPAALSQAVIRARILNTSVTCHRFLSESSNCPPIFLFTAPFRVFCFAPQELRVAGLLMQPLC